MAPSAWIASEATTSAHKAGQFYSQFTSVIKDLESQIQSAQRVADLDPPLRQISTARNHLTDSTGFLPTHDRQIHEKNLTRLTRTLTAKRQALQPARTGFTFKRKPQGHNKSLQVNPVQSQRTTVAPVTAATESLALQDQSRRYIPLSILQTTSDRLHDLHLVNLTECIVDLRSPTMQIGALQMRNLDRCVILAGNVKGSVMIHHTHKSWLIIESCRQFRMHTSSSALVCLCTNGSIATIEACRALRFTEGVPRSLVSSPPPDATPLQIQDFDLLLTSSHLGGSDASPNFELIPLSETDSAASQLCLQDPSADTILSLCM